MTRPPYNDARRVFWIVENRSVYRGQRAGERLRQQYPRRPAVQLVHAPTHASWLHQVEIYFSIVQRKLLTPSDFPSLDVLAERLLDFQYYWESTAQPFDWRFTRQDLKELLAKFDQRDTRAGAIPRPASHPQTEASAAVSAPEDTIL